MTESKVQLWEVNRINVIEITGASPDSPFATARWVVGKAKARRPVFLVRLRGSENETKCGIVGYRVQILRGLVPCDSVELIPKSGIDRQPRSDLPIILRETIVGFEIRGEKSRAGPAQVSIEPIGNLIIDEDR